MISDPSAKRNTCKNCATVLIPGLTSKIRNRRKSIRPQAALTDFPASRYHMNVSHTTCIACSTQKTLPLPPTSTIEAESIDGKKRAQRRRRLADQRKVPFHQRESAPTTSDDKNGSRGHTLFQNQVALHGWGETPISTEESEDNLSVAR
jgi:ribonuclease P protein subunit RPR2